MFYRFQPLLWKSLHSSRFFGRIMLLVVVLAASLPSQASQAAPDQPTQDTSEEIVYIDNVGQIKVLDPVAADNKFVKWVSPENGYYNFALGDFNADGDQEIVALHRTNKQLVVFDPVVTSGSNDGQIEGIPWKKLVTLSLTGSPNIVATGNFDVNVPGDEIAVGYETGGSPPYRVDILKGTSTTPNGASWTVHQTKDFSFIWEDTAVGDVLAGGAEELVLRTFSAGKVTVFQFDTGFVETGCKYDASDKKPFDITVLQWTPGGSAEVAMTREFPGDGSVNFPRLLIFGCNGNEFIDGYTNKYSHVPVGIFPVDVTNDNIQNDALILVRQLPSDDPRDRMFAENGLGDFHTQLDADNNYIAGSAGDTDGDGKDEVAIMRDNKIRLYNAPEIGAASTQPANYTEYAVPTNRYVIEIGDLDKNPAQLGYSLISDKASMSASVSAGDILNNAGIFTVKLNSDALSLQHNLPTTEGLPAGVTFTFDPIGDDTPFFTPTTYLFHINATNATTPRPGQPYTGNILVTSNDAKVINQLRIPFTLTLGYARLEAAPSAITLSYFPCDESSTQIKTFSNLVKLEGTPGVNFDVIGGTRPKADSPEVLPDWLKVTPESGKVGDFLSFSVDPTKWPSKSFEEATVFVLGDAKTDGQVRKFKVGVICATSQLHLPIVAR